LASTAAGSSSESIKATSVTRKPMDSIAILFTYILQFQPQQQHLKKFQLKIAQPIDPMKHTPDAFQRQTALELDTHFRFLNALAHAGECHCQAADDGNRGAALSNRANSA